MNTDIKILDGGMGRELQRMGAPFQQPEWSALALIEDPQSVLIAHLNFIQAGAEIIITNSYACIPYHIGQERFDHDGPKLIKCAADMATQARQRSEKEILIAGSIPPLFGSYHPENYNAGRALNVLQPLIDNQTEAVDVWIVETIGSVEEALFVSQNLQKTGKPIWLAFAVKNMSETNKPMLFSGETLDEAVKTLYSQANHLEAALINCSAPEDISESLPVLNKALLEIDRIPVMTGAYANSFERGSRKSEANDGLPNLRQEMTPARYLEFAQYWAKLGATIIGGCCGIGPDHIQALQTLKGKTKTEFTD